MPVIQLPPTTELWEQALERVLTPDLAFLDPRSDALLAYDLLEEGAA